MTIADFVREYGVSAVARRHFGYNKPVSDGELGGYPTRGALTYTRTLDHSRLGLTFKEGEKAYNQAGQFAAHGVVPALIIAGADQRNFDGARFTAEGFGDLPGGTAPRFYTSPAVTYPHYTDFTSVQQALSEHGDYAVHAYLAGALQGIWSEPPEVFEARIVAAITANYSQGPVLFDLNFEQVTLLYFRLVKGLKREQIPFANGSWTPTMGGGIILSADRKIASEFKPDLTIVE